MLEYRKVFFSINDAPPTGKEKGRIFSYALKGEKHLTVLKDVSDFKTAKQKVEQIIDHKILAENTNGIQTT